MPKVKKKAAGKKTAAVKKAKREAEAENRLYYGENGGGLIGFSRVS